MKLLMKEENDGGFVMVTAFGKFCRKLRIDRGQIMLDMAESLQVSPAFLSAVENGKKNVPAQWRDKIVKAYAKGGNPSLDGNYTVFGQVIDGMDVVDKIADAEVKDNADGSEKSLPVDPVKVLSTVVTTK